MIDSRGLTGLGKLYITFRAALLTRVPATGMIHHDPDGTAIDDLRERLASVNKEEKLFASNRKSTSRWLATGAWVAAMTLLVGASSAQGPLRVKVNITPVASYTGASSLPRPGKILIYDFTVNSEDVQVDKIQAMRPRNLITGSKNPDSVAESAGKKYYQELIKALEKTGIPVEHVADGAVPTNNTLVIKGSFTSLREGNKTERDTIGMGAGSADVETKVDVHLKTPSDTVLVSQFQTDTRAAKGTGSVVPVAAGMNPAGAVAKSTIGDRKKTLNAYASKTAEATAKEILKSMATQGWVKINDKGEVVQ